VAQWFLIFALWAAAAAVLRVIIRRNLRADPAPSVLGLSLLLALGCFGAIYVLQPHSLKWMFWSSASRLIVHMWPAVVVALVAAVPWKAAAIELEDPERDVRGQQTQDR
jgi:hypothetical protein